MNDKKRDFHDLIDDEEESDAGDFELEDSRFSAIPNKKRRVEDNVGDEATGESEDDYEQDDQSLEQDTRLDAANPVKEKQAVKKLKPLTPAQLAASQRKAKKTGVIYISRVPPFMKPATVRKLLSPCGEIGRIFLTPEPTPMHQQRVRNGGNKKRSFVDGWVEFVSKKRAKACVELLNGKNIAGKKGGFYYDDLWNLKYLKGFKWSDLMEQVQVEERMREGRLRAELEKEGKERKAFLRNMGIAKRDQRIKSNAESKADENVGEDQESRAEKLKQTRHPDGQPRTEWRFKQSEVKASSKVRASDADGVQRVMKNIF